MSDKNFLAELSNMLSPADLAVAAASLWQDAIIWQALQQNDLVNKIGQRGAGLAVWTPANLALASLGCDDNAESLLADPETELDGDLLQRALNTYDGLMTGSAVAGNLVTAALVAVALRERNRLSLTWQLVFDRKNGHLPAGQTQLIKTSLACLYGLVNDPDVLLRAVIAGQGSETGLDWACHCILTNPQPEDRMKEIMTGLLLDLTTEQQVDWLRLLQLKGWKSLAAGLSESLVVAGQVISENLPDSVNSVAATEMPQRMQQLQQMAILCIHAGKQDEARRLLESAEQFAQHNLASIQIQMANLSQAADNPVTVWNDAVKSPWLQADLSLVAGERPWDSQLEATDETPSGFVLLRKAGLAELRGEREIAQKLARAGTAALPSLAFTKTALWGQTGANWDPAAVVARLAEMELFEDAGRIAKASIEARRMDVDLLGIASQVFERLGRSEDAVDAARMVCAATPGNVDNVRKLASLFERCDDWENALQMRRKVLTLENRPSTEDTLHVANAALQSGAIGGTLEVCRQVLEQDPDQGGAHALLGLALLQQGDRETALEHLSRATLLSPEEPRAWLALSDVQRQDGDAQGALGTLRAAVLAAPDSAELNYALAKACLESGQPSEALPFLWEAARLDASQAEVAWKLARTLHELGHNLEARQVIDQARWRWPEHVMTAFVDAELLLDAGQLKRAIPALETALSGENPEPEWWLMHARALLGLMPGAALSNIHTTGDERLNQAQESLKKMIAAKPANLEARILLAEVQHALGAMQEAYEMYRSLIENPNLAHTGWRWRVQAGLGCTALALDEVETAIASLREAAQSHPENVQVQQTLAEAYLRTNLLHEAVRTARQVLVLDTENVDNLGWFIDIMTRMGKSEETLTALETVTRLAPEQAPFWNRLARVQLIRGDTEAAHHALDRLLAIPEIKLDDFRSCARTFLMMGESQTALDCLRKTMAADEPTPLDIQYAIASLLHQNGQADEALTLAQDYAANEHSPAEARILLADVLAWQGKTQEALDCLQAVKQDCPVGEGWTGVERPQDDLLPEGWRETAVTSSGLYARMAALEWSRGELPKAFEIACQALEANPADAAVRLLAVELARGCGETAKALQIASELQADPQVNGLTIWDRALVSVQAELALENGEDALAAKLVEQYIAVIPEETHLLALQARLLGRMGDQQEALTALEAAAVCSGHSMTERENILKAEDLNELIWRIFQDSNVLYRAEAALDLELWGEAIRGFDTYTEQHPVEPRGFIRKARAFVICGEQQQLCEALRAEQHAPASHSQKELWAECFASCTARIEELTGENTDAAFWKVRGQAVFEPSLRQAPAVAKLAPTSENASALLSLLRRTKNAANAVRIAHHYPENPMLLAQLALCYREVDVLKGLETARKAVEKNPQYPLYYAALAQLEEDSGNAEAALDALEIALGGWQDEPDWHAWAGDLFQELGEEQRSLACWEEALTLRPNSACYALVVGQKHMEFGNAERAIEVLEHSSEVNPEESKVWVALAQAFRMAGRLEEALECTNQASEIAPEDASSYLASGEIALQMGKPDAALEYAHTAVECEPNQPAAVLFTSKVLVQKGQLAEGLTVLEKAMPVLHGSLPVMMERANLIHRLYGAQVALPVYLELAQLFPQESAVLNMLAQTQTECGDLKAAERTAYSAHHINPDHPQLNFLLGRLQHASGQLDQAIHFLSEAIRQSPAEIEPYLELGQAYLERREHLKALQTYQQAIKVSGRDHRPFYRAALVLRDSKDYVGAETMLRRAADLAPDDLNIRRQLGAVVALNLVHNTQEVNSPL